MTRYYAVDVAKYQPTNLHSYANAGAKLAIVQVSVSDSIVAPKARAQVVSARANNMKVAAYFYACFGNSVSRAKSEASFAVKCAKSSGVKADSMLAVDWEGQDNDTSGSVSANTAAILAAMRVIKNAGYQAMLYSGADLLYRKVNTKAIVKEFGTCLWVARYAVEGRIDKPNFGYFPSMDGVAIWQFTDNWKGLSVDGNIILANVNANAESAIVKKSSKNKLATNGLFELNTSLNIHVSAHVSARSIAKLRKGDVVKYDKVIKGPLRTWIRQPRANGNYGYIVAVDRYGHKQGKNI
ncbi:GH25 family lysozyme [Lactobacillus kitasatonis]|uniref:GH25 family lysozyme n=1 Tax=Lactobacillus kitasatonis TaxID=237446 RepID=UPI003F66257B